MKTGELELSPAQKTLFVLAAAVVVLFAVKEAKVLLTPALLALLIALAVLPAQQWLGHRIGRVPAYLVMLAAVFLAIVAATVVLALGAAGFAAQLARLTGRADEVYRQALTLFAGLGLQPGRVVGAVRGGEVASPERLLAAAGSVLEAVGDFGLIVLLAVVMLADAVRLREKVDALELTKGGMVDRLECVVGDVRDYLRITALAGVMIAVPATGLFLLLGIPLAPLWGLLIGLLKFVPVLGFWLALVAPIMLLALERGLW